MRPQKIILVYNADEGFFNALNDWAHKFFSLQTYECSLCRYTYGLNGMRLPWKQFIESLNCPVVFLHRNEFRKRYPSFDISLPAILVEMNGRPRVLLASNEIAAAGNLETLIRAVRDRLGELGQVSTA